MDRGQLVDSSGTAELVEHAAPAYGMELTGVADEDQSPLLRLGEADELVERARAAHAGFVVDDGRAGR